MAHLVEKSIERLNEHVSGEIYFLIKVWLAQLVEHLSFKQKDKGSIPLSRIEIYVKFKMQRLVRSLTRSRLILKLFGVIQNPKTRKVGGFDQDMNLTS